MIHIAPNMKCIDPHLIFVFSVTEAGFLNPKCYTEKVKFMHFTLKKENVCIFRSMWTNLHLTKILYTGTDHSAGDKHQVCIDPICI